MTYQWRKSGEAIDGAIDSLLTLEPVTQADYGDYDVVVSNPGGSVISDVAALSTPPPPELLSHPQSTAASLGSYVLLGVSAGGLDLSFQWRKDGVPLSGKTGYDLSIGPITATDYGLYDCVVSNPSGSVTSVGALVAEPRPPGLASQPANVTAVIGGTVTYSVAATGTGPITYQWKRDGVDIPGATKPALTLTNVQAGQGVNYSVVVTSPFGSVTSDVATLTIDATPRLINVSCRAAAGSGGDTLIAGFFISGTGSKEVLIRGIGPKLLEYGVPLVVADPLIHLYDSGGSIIDSNDDWDSSLDTSFSAVGAFPLDAGSKDAALKATLAPGLYTVHLVNNGETGDGLIEVYDLSRDLGTRLTNVSSRLHMNGGQTIVLGTALIGGPVHVLARNVGPGLAPYLPNPADALPDPKLQFFVGSTEIDSNDNWSDGTGAYFGPTGAFPLTSGSKDAAMRVLLSPGGATFPATDASGGSGVALIELYESP